jgi:hypothetical protein
MNETNPYKAPESRVADVAADSADANFLPAGRAVDAGHGWGWITSGFDLFKKQPGVWILIALAYFAILIVLGLIPLLGSIANMLLYPVFGAGLMLGCRALESDESLEFAHLFAGFKRNTSDLVMLGLLTLVGFMIVLIPLFLVVGGGAFLGAMRGDASAIAGAGLGLVIGSLLTLALIVPLYMALWFAPALVIFHGMKPVEALKASFFACLRNIVPFLLYGVITLVLFVIASIPFGLGLLVLIPVLVASIYAGYRDIFFDR